jgi:hypothetical protein
MGGLLFGGSGNAILYGTSPHSEFKTVSNPNIAAKQGEYGSVTVQFGGCYGKTANSLPTMPDWATWCAYRSRAEILNSQGPFLRPSA